MLGMLRGSSPLVMAVVLLLVLLCTMLPSTLANEWQSHSSQLGYIYMLQPSQARWSHVDKHVTMYSHSYSPPTGALTLLTEVLLQPNATNPFESRRGGSNQQVRLVLSGALSTWDSSTGVEHVLPAGSVEVGLDKEALRISRDSNRAASDLAHYLDIQLVPVVASVSSGYEARQLPHGDNLNRLRLVAANIAWLKHIAENSVAFDGTVPSDIPGINLPHRSVFWSSDEAQPLPLHQDVFVHDCVLEAKETVQMRFRLGRVYFVQLLSSDREAAIVVGDEPSSPKLTAGDGVILTKYHRAVLTFRGIGAHSHFVVLDMPAKSHELLMPDRDSLLGSYPYAKPTPPPKPTSEPIFDDEDVESIRAMAANRVRIETDVPGDEEEFA